MREGRLSGDRQGGRLWLAFLLIFGLIFVRYCCYGLEYFPQLDDYIQMHNYTAYRKDVWAFIIKLGALTTRPAAGVLDILFWGHLWPVLMLGVALMSLLYAGSAVLFCRTWRAYFGTGWIFLTAYALLPLGMEGTYWMSASTRVVPGLFFTALSMLLFQRWCRTGRRRLLAGWFLGQLASFCFYEQSLVLSITGTALIALLEWKEHSSRSKWALLTLVNITVYIIFTSSFPENPAYAGRGDLTLPWQPGWGGVFRSAMRQTLGAFIKGGVYTTVKAFLRGARLILSEGRWLWLALVLVLCAGLFRMVQTEREAERPQGRRLLLPVVVGFLMVLAPVSIFFVLSNPWLSLRGTVTSFCGGALMADALLGWLLQRLKNNRETVNAALCTAAALVFCIAALSEMHDYRATYEDDQAVMAALCAASNNGADLPREGGTLALGVEPTFLPEQNFSYHEHIHGVTESDWALTGGLQCVSGWGDFPLVRPMSAYAGAWEIGASGCAAFYLYDPDSRTAQAVTLDQTADGYELRNAGGALVGRWTGEGLVRSGT